MTGKTTGVAEQSAAADDRTASLPERAKRGRKPSGEPKRRRMTVRGGRRSVKAGASDRFGLAGHLRPGELARPTVETVENGQVLVGARAQLLEAPGPRQQPRLERSHAIVVGVNRLVER